MEKANQVSFIARGLIVTTCLVIVIAGLKQSANLIAPILFAFTLTILVWPILQWLQQRGIPRWLAILLVTGAVISFFALMTFIIYNSLQQLTTKLPEYTDQLNDQLQPLLRFFESLPADISLLPEGGIDGTAVMRAVIDIILNFITNIFNVGIFLLSLLLMVIASEGFVQKLRSHFNKDSTVFTSFASWSKSIQQQYSVQTISNLASAVVAAILYTVLGIDFAILWGVLTFILAYIPNLGIILSSAPPVILAFILYGWQAALLTVVLIAILNLLMDNVVTPRLMGQQLKVPEIIVFLSFTIWTWVFGPLGAFISLPLTLAIRSLLANDPSTEIMATFLGAEDATAGRSRAKQEDGERPSAK